MILSSIFALVRSYWYLTYPALLIPLTGIVLVLWRLLLNFRAMRDFNIFSAELERQTISHREPH
jgi:hypothetical protein